MLLREFLHQVPALQSTDDIREQLLLVGPELAGAVGFHHNPVSGYWCGQVAIRSEHSDFTTEQPYRAFNPNACHGELLHIEGRNVSSLPGNMRALLPLGRRPSDTARSAARVGYDIGSHNIYALQAMFTPRAEAAAVFLRVQQLARFALGMYGKRV